jgi:hypothetical protein
MIEQEQQVTISKAEVCRKNPTIDVKDLKILFKGKEIIIPQIAYKKRKMLQIISEGSLDYPIPRSLLIEEEMRDDKSNDETAAKDRVNSRISNIRKDLEERGLTIAVRKSESDKRTGGYYLGEKDDFVRKKKRMRWNIASGISSEKNIIELGSKDNQLKISTKKPDEGEIFPKASVFVAKTEERLDQKHLLTEDETCIVALSLLKRGMLIGLRIDALYIRGIQNLFDKIASKVEAKKQTVADLEKENIQSALNKFNEYQKDSKKYTKACDERAKAVLACFEGAKIGSDLWEKLFPDQIRLIRETMVKKVI